ncbi:hypothetical protein QA643_28705 [Bradyrhizobium sp. CB3481]|nr:hypothetical protein [Bradyrhizobium sp. CB3481]WFU20640.1 hypothetical protein QA643_28705 [Bradyrhizobium sp. CB3481]
MPIGATGGAARRIAERLLSAPASERKKMRCPTNAELKRLLDESQPPLNFSPRQWTSCVRPLAFERAQVQRARQVLVNKGSNWLGDLLEPSPDSPRFL